MGSHKAFIGAWPGWFWPSACCIYTSNVSSSLSSHTSFCPLFFFKSANQKKCVSILGPWPFHLPGAGGCPYSRLDLLLACLPTFLLYICLGIFGGGDEDGEVDLFFGRCLCSVCVYSRGRGISLSRLSDVNSIPS